MSYKSDSYKRLGDYIQEVDIRNRDLQCTKLLGLSIAKTFIPSIANTVGTDFRPYKIVKHNQFAYVPVTSRNGDKITVALYDGEEDCIISQAYISFEIKDTSKLLPEYLMIWFRRPEFDRYARFKSHGSAREVFDWEEMCNVLMPIPDIKEQKRIVDQYNAIQNRIETNKQTIVKLEETAQTIYRKMLVDDIAPENLPKGWSSTTVGELCPIITGKKDANFGTDDGAYPFFTCAQEPIKAPTYSFDKTAIILGGNGDFFLRIFRGKFEAYQRTYIIEPYNPDNIFLVYFPLMFNMSRLRSESKGSTISFLTKGMIEEIPVIIPTTDILKKFNHICFTFQQRIEQLQKEDTLLSNCLSELLTAL